MRGGESSHKHMLRGHAMFVRFMDKWQLSDCVHYFAEDMTLGRLRQLTSHELLMSYRVRDAGDRERIMKAVEEARTNDSSDTEVSSHQRQQRHRGKLAPTTAATQR